MQRRSKQRLGALEELNEKPMLRDEIREYLNPIYDLERLISRISYKSANPRDLVSFASSLEMLPYIKQVLAEFQICTAYRRSTKIWIRWKILRR